MPTRKEMTASAVADTLFIPLQRHSVHELLDVGHPIPVRAVATINYAVVPRLQLEWADRVVALFYRQLTTAEIHVLTGAITRYVQGRVEGENPIFWDDFRGGLERFATTSRALLDEFDRQTAAQALAWSMVVESSQGPAGQRLDRDDLYPLISTLHAASVRALEGARLRREEGVKGDYAAPWTALVHTLAKLFESTGGRVTASKGLRDGSYAKPSPFVELVWAVMHEAIPKRLREHTYSVGAMADAISNTLSKQRQRKS